METVVALTRELFGETPYLVGNSSNFHFVTPSIFIKASRKIFKPMAARNEVVAARFLHESGFPVAQPLLDPISLRDADGDERMVTFWERLDVVNAEGSLAQCERWVTTFSLLPAHRADLPLLNLYDYCDFVRVRLNDVDHPLKTRILQEIEVLRLELPDVDAASVVFSHGDVRPDNFVTTSHAVVPVDFEASCLAPPEWDAVQLLRFAGEDDRFLVRNPRLDRDAVALLKRLRTLSHMSALILHGREDVELRRWLDALGWA